MTAFSIRPATGVLVGSDRRRSFLPRVTPAANFLRSRRSMCWLVAVEVA